MKRKENEQIFPVSKIGILGEGQLGKYLAINAQRMGYQVLVYGNQPEGVAYSCCHEKYISRDIEGGYLNFSQLEKFGKACDVVLLEFENVPTETLEFLKQFTRVCPDENVLRVTQDRWLEKELCRKLNIKTATTFKVGCLDDIHQIPESSFPGILKTRTLGYDGKGQFKVSNTEELQEVWLKNRKNGTVTFVYEQFVDFLCEVSVIVGRNAAGTTVSLPLVQNIHENGILRSSTYPAGITHKNLTIENEATALAQTIAQELNVVGLIAVEMFITKDLKILVNELAPRPHNSGHLSIDAYNVNQYELYIRAVCNLMMPQIIPHSQATMTNLLGLEVLNENWFKTAASVHIYGKKEIKEGRKMGHVTQLLPFKK